MDNVGFMFGDALEFFHSWHLEILSDNRCYVNVTLYHLRNTSTGQESRRSAINTNTSQDCSGCALDRPKIGSYAFRQYAIHVVQHTRTNYFLQTAMSNCIGVSRNVHDG